MTSMMDLANRNIPTAPAGPGSPPAMDPVTEAMQRQRMDQVDQSRTELLQSIQRGQVAEAEAARLAAESKLEEERAHAEEMRQARLKAMQSATNGGDTGAVVSALGTMLTDTFGRLNEMVVGQGSKSDAEIRSLREMVTALVNRPAPDPLEQVKSMLTMFEEVRKISEARMPAALPTPQQGWTPRDLIEWRLAELRAQREQTESEDRRSAISAQIAKDEATRDSILGFLGMLGERFGEEGQKVAAGLGNRTPANAPPEPTRIVRPWHCSACGFDNVAEDGQEVGFCGRCKQGFRLVNPGAAPPDPPPPPEA